MNKLTNCTICPRNCKVDRTQNIGFCGQQDKIRVARAGLHMWEEPLISGSQGSGTIFFSGCNLQCVYCQNYDIAHGKGDIISVAQLADLFRKLEDKGANNINLVTPTHFATKVVEAVEIYKPSIPLVYNCGGYEDLNTLKLLDGIVDIYLPDFKYADNLLAQQFSFCDNYMEVCTQALIEMKRQVGEDILHNGLLKRGMIIRHLVLPNAVNNSLQVLDWLGDNMDKSTYISIMGQYVPYGKANNYPQIARKLKPLEYKIVLEKVEKLGFYNTFIQDLSSASSDYIPDFDCKDMLSEILSNNY